MGLLDFLGGKKASTSQVPVHGIGTQKIRGGLEEQALGGLGKSATPLGGQARSVLDQLLSGQPPRAINSRLPRTSSRL